MKNKMQHTSKLGIKKKIDLIEPKQNKTRLGTEKKPPLKSELIAQLKSLQELNDILKHENDILKQENEKNLVKMKDMDLTVKRLQTSSIVTSSKGAQTVSNEMRISCNLCIYVATCEEELNWHMGEEHEQSDESYFDKDFYCDICSKWFDKESDMLDHKKDHVKKKPHSNHEDLFYCNFCEEKFHTKRELMKHKKNVHSEKVTICWRFATGTCDFGDQNCWFSHCPSRILDSAKFNCRTCGKEFKFLSDCLKHRKQEHSQFVPDCSKDSNGTCKFGQNYCWFTHKNSLKRNRTEDDES